ncbi:MAG: hypothetical protein JXB50_00665 [Spirochaetes bacterium]|nr:hypothetical protein [Spirochaetota bacterium]
MKKISLIMCMIILIMNCKTTGEKKPQSTEKVRHERIPGIETMRKYGRKIDPDAVFDILADTVSKLGGAGFSYTLFNEILNSSNDEDIYIVESIEYNDKGLATKINGHIEKPSSYREFIIRGGLGSPVYEAVEPNEFGVVFGRSGNIAVRDGVVVRINTLEQEEFYELLMGSEMYDEFSRAALLSQAALVVKTPYLKNYIVELEGIVLNSASKKAILEGIKQFKNDPQNKDKSNEEILINFLAANKSYLEELNESNKNAKIRIKKSRELLDLFESAMAVQSVNIAKIISQIALDTVAIVLDFRNAPYLIAEYVEKNIPKNTGMTYQDLKNIEKYGNYRVKKADECFKANKEINRKIAEINREILK